MFELTPGMITVITAVVLVVTQFYKIYKERGGAPLTKKQLTWGSFIFAAVLGIPWALFSQPWNFALPVFSDDPAAFFTAIADFVGELASALGYLAGVVFVVYQYVAKKLFENIGFE